MKDRTRRPRLSKNGVPLGRPPKLPMSEERMEVFYKALHEGNFLNTACALVDVHTDSVHRWLKTGQRNIAEGQPDTPEANFYVSVKNAMAHAESKRVAALNRAMSIPAHWTAAAWWLERTRPAEWGPKKEVTLTPKPTALALDIERMKATPEGRDLLDGLMDYMIEDEDADNQEGDGPDLSLGTE